MIPDQLARREQIALRLERSRCLLQSLHGFGTTRHITKLMAT
jgi:hypothetical protein